ncbi:MAG: preprotein translocase subunit SecE [Actinomycetota bacterium]|nr:preprotein translocase subunit SecE [Actinomycetota bacterium]
MKKQEEQKKAPARPTAKAPGSPTKRERTKPREFIKEVGQELRKVAWPTRQEVVGYSLVVLVSSIVIAALIFVMDLLFTEGVLFLFDIEG